MLKSATKNGSHNYYAVKTPLLFIIWCFKTPSGNPGSGILRTTSRRRRTMTWGLPSRATSLPTHPAPSSSFSSTVQRQGKFQHKWKLKTFKKIVYTIFFVNLYFQYLYSSKSFFRWSEEKSWKNVLYFRSDSEQDPDPYQNET